jgi:hypothetical protein
MKRSVSGQGGITGAAVQRLVAIVSPLLLIGAASAQPTPTKSATPTKTATPAMSATPGKNAVPSKTAVPALYPTRAEAEKAARLHFHCSGAHPMGSQWMPCAQHGSDHSSHP